MAPPDIETVQSALSPLGPVLTQSFLQAWKDWQAAGKTQWTKRGRANYVWEEAVHHAKIGFAKRDDVTIVPKNESYHFLVKGAIAFRLKKADSSGFTSNYPTQEAMAFHDPQLPLTGIPAEHRVEVTYTLNRTETDITDVLVVARDGEKIAWTYSLLRADSVISLPSKASKDASAKKTGKTGLVRPKGQKNKPDETGNAGDQ